MINNAVNNKGLVSIVLPVYNGEKYLAEAIESVLQQTYQNWELIVVDDCSTDRTASIISEYVKADTRIRAIRNRDNMMLPASLNIGFEVARGEYYTWTSDDNEYEKSALKAMKDYLDYNQDIQMVYADMSIVDDEGRTVRKKPQMAPKCLAYKNVVGACFLYRKSTALKVGYYNPEFALAEDYDYWIRISKIGVVEHLDGFFYRYRVHGGSMTDNKKEEITEQTYRVIIQHAHYLYSLLKNGKERIEFCRNLEYRGRDHDKKEVQREIYKIRPTYRIRILLRGVKKLIT